MGIDIQRIGTTRDKLGEGPLWDSQAQMLYWIDSMGGIVHRLDPARDRYDNWSLPGQFIGSLAIDMDGKAILALTEGFHSFDFESGEAVPLVLPEAGHPEVRFNDGKVDREGRFVAGTVVRPGCDEPVGVLYRLTPDKQVEKLERGIHISNGPCFSPDGRTFYFTDSLRRQIWAYDYPASSEPPTNRRVLFDTSDMATLPDGATVDCDGCLWSALVLIGKLCRITPSGKLDRIVDMPVPHPTSVMFGGRGLDTLYVTSVTETETGRFRPTDDLSGGLFAVTGLGVTGIAEPRFGFGE